MPSFNRVMLIGHMTRDPQTRYLPNQTAVVDFGLAMNRKFKTASGEDREEVTFVDVTFFGKAGEVIQKFCTKGKPIFIEGRLKYDTWDDKNGGGKRSKLSVIGDNFQFIGGRDNGDDGSQEQEYPRTKTTSRSKPQTAPPFDDPDPDFDSDIPFTAPTVRR